jgi:outer membrane lipoprotein-sorting protein
MRLLLLIPVMFIQIAYAQDITRVQDKKAEPILNKVADEFSKENAFQVEFQYEIYSAAEDASVSDFGSVIIKGSKYKLKTEDTEVLFNGTYLWTYSILNEEVYKSEPDPGSSDQMLTNPFKLLSDYKTYYKYRLKGEAELNKQELTEIELYPVDLENNYSMIELYTHPVSNKLQAMIIKQKDGLEIKVFIKDIIKNIKISDAVFDWNQNDHPEVLLIEM